VIVADPEIEGPVEDVSRGGLFLRTEATLPIGTRHPIELRRAGGRKGLSMSGWVVRQVPGPDAAEDTVAGLGILFDALDPEMEAELLGLLTEVGEPEAAPPPLPAPPKRNSSESVPAFPEVPPRGERFDGDPFQERPEPRPPRSAMPDEKLEFFRGLVNLKNEALDRGRSVYSQAIAEADTLHEVATALRKALDGLVVQVEQWRASARDLGSMQARVTQLESELSAKQSVLDFALAARGDLERELDGLQTELAVAKERARNAEAALEIARTDAEGVHENLERQVLEAKRTLKLERDQTAKDRDRLTKLEAEAGDKAVKKLRDELAAANKKAMEAQASLNREHREREALQLRFAEADKAAAEVTAERDAARADLASMKRKLIAAEEALETKARQRKTSVKPS
jgi:hypothetical protein